MENVEVTANDPNGQFSKTRKHFASLGHKFDTDKLRVMLREKCRIRIRQARGQVHDNARTFLVDEKQWISSVLKEFEENIELEDLIWQEIVDESYQWMVENYEKELEYLASTENLTQLVICPICQLTELTMNDGVLSCSCGFKLNYRGSANDFWKCMQQVIGTHEENCESALTFYLEPNEFEQMRLISMCKKCDYYAEVE